MRIGGRNAAGWAAALAAAIALGHGATHAGITDPAGDFLATFTGPQNPDVDAIAADVVLNTLTNELTFTATLDGAIGATPGALYVWGLNRGQGTARFGALAPGVLFDGVLLLRPDGTGVFNDFIGGAPVDLAAGSVIIDGPTITAVVPTSVFTPRGFLLPDFLYNLWPRVGLGANDQIADFAPDNASFLARTVPEPSALALAGLGAAALGWYGRRRRRKVVA